MAPARGIWTTGTGTAETNLRKRNVLARERHWTLSQPSRSYGLSLDLSAESYRKPQPLVTRVSTRAPETQLRCAKMTITPETDHMKLKEIGNEAYKKGDFDLALDAYTRAMDISRKEKSCNEDLAILYKNRAAVHIKNQEFQSAVADCTKCLELVREITSVVRLELLNMYCGNCQELLHYQGSIVFCTFFI